VNEKGLESLSNSSLCWSKLCLIQENIMKIII